MSGLYPWVAWHGGRGANVIYFGSLSRMQGLLLGSLGAQLWVLGVTDWVSARARRAVGWGATAVLGHLVFGVGNVTFKYLGALTVAGVAATAVTGSLLVAELSWRLIEAPAQRLARRRSPGPAGSRVPVGSRSGLA
ncbi:hypothetical protein K6U06_08780 [Acidiferrimicrobium sp. IK]|uniref:hypothetical protein n=1 Tax=Acidiferrimicrobium sp. IK TaxID=2871700 RepID=UPI0021CAF24A|nr:hypothetical protein [Acidiferrimicrobium sp. IK]MCU4184453.1 hypothetical protein [Acidiferrimicrobium sp. IK]